MTDSLSRHDHDRRFDALAVGKLAGLWFEGRGRSRSTLHCAYQRCLDRAYLVEEKNAGSS